MDGRSDFIYNVKRSRRDDLHLMGRGDQITRPGLLGTPGLVFFWSVVGRGIGFSAQGGVGSAAPQISKPAGLAQCSHIHARICRLRILLKYLLGVHMGEVIRLIPKSELERDRLIREARANYERVFPTTDSGSESRAPKEE